MTSLITNAGRPTRACRFLFVAAVALSVSSLGAQATTDSEPAVPAAVSVREQNGAYLVRAQFDVAQAAHIARAVLTDYEQIPRFMPDVKTSVVVERTASRLLVEQEAVSKFGLFSKTVHLRLEVIEDGNTIRFIDRCGTSFKHYGGSWTLRPTGSGTTLTYELTAQPDFGVPELIIKRLLKRDAGEMIARLRGEIATRGQ